MSENNILLLIHKDSRFFCNRNSSFFRITGNHDYLDSCMVKNLNCLDCICSYIITQTQNSHKNGFRTVDLCYGEKLHCSLRLCVHLFFYFILICFCELFFFSVRKHIVCYFLNDVLCSTFPVNKSILKCYSCTFLL